MKTLLLLFPIFCFAHIEKHIAQKANQMGISEDVAICIAKIESSLNPTAMGDDNKSIGLFQLQCRTAYDVGYSRKYPCKWLLNYKYNTKFALRYLKHKIDKHGLYYGIAAYNQGHVCIRKGQVCNIGYLNKFRKCLRDRL